MGIEALKAIFEVTLLLFGLFSFPFAYFKARGWESTGVQSAIWTVLAAVAGYFCLLLMKEFHDAGGDISGGYHKMGVGIFLLVALPAFAGLFGLAAISTFLATKGTTGGWLFFPALSILVFFLIVWVPPQISGRPLATSKRTYDPSKPQGTSKIDGANWAAENNITSVDECKRLSKSKSFIEGCAIQAQKR